MTRVYALHTEYDQGHAKWLSLWRDFDDHDESEPLNIADCCKPLIGNWDPPLCHFATRACPEPDFLSLVLHCAVNARAKNILSKHFGDAVEFLPLQVFDGVVMPKDLGPILNPVGAALAAIKNWWTKAKLDNADNYWLLHVIESVAPDPDELETKRRFSFHHDPAERVEDLSAFRIRRSSDTDAVLGNRIWVTDTFIEVCNQNQMTGLKFKAVHTAR